MTGRARAAAAHSRDSGAAYPRLDGSPPSGHEETPEDALPLSEPAASATPSGRPDAPRLSILVPTWNAATTVERALDSVLAERVIPLEVVVVDDASTDGTADLVAAIAERDPRVVLLRLPANGGVSNARNRGLELVRGEWLAFLDADDLLLPGALDALMAPTAADPAVRAVIGQRIQNNGERRWISKGYDNPDVRTPGRKSIATHPRLMYYASIHGKVFHRSLIRGLEFEGRVLGDQPWTIRALLRAGDGIEVIGETVYEWTHPHPDHWVETITSATKASAGRAADMARMAPGSFARSPTRSMSRSRTRRSAPRSSGPISSGSSVRSERPGQEGARPARSGHRAPVRGDRRVPRRGAGRDRRDLRAPGRARPPAPGQTLAGARPFGAGELLGDAPAGAAGRPTDGPADRLAAGGPPRARARSACSLRRSARRPHRRSCLALVLPTRVRRRLRRT